MPRRPTATSLADLEARHATETGKLAANTRLAARNLAHRLRVPVPAFARARENDRPRPRPRSQLDVGCSFLPYELILWKRRTGGTVRFTPEGVQLEAGPVIKNFPNITAAAASVA